MTSSSSGSPAYEIIADPKFAQDLRRLELQAASRPAEYGHLYRETMRELLKLQHGTSDGRHPLGHESGKGDLRDCVTSYIKSDPQKKADHRLVFREMPPAEPAQLPRRELLALKPRQGSSGIYAHVAARLGRHPQDRQPGLNVFGDRRPGLRENAAQRKAELDTKRAIAHAFPGQQPLASSRPLDPAAFGRRSPVGARAAPGRATGRSA